MGIFENASAAFQTNKSGYGENESTKTIELESEPFEGPLGTFLQTMCVVLSFIIIVGNLLTLYVMETTPSLRTVQNKYIHSLAFADCLVGLALLEIYIVGYFGYKCHVTLAVLHTSLGVSMLNMMAIAIDRYIFIAHPFVHMRIITNRFTNIVIAIEWLVACCYGFIPTYVFDLGNRKSCHPFFTLHHTVLTYCYVAHFFLNIMVIGILYGLIARIAKKKMDERERLKQHLINVLGKPSTEDTSAKRRPVLCPFIRLGKKQKSDLFAESNAKRSELLLKCNRENKKCMLLYLWEKHEIPFSMLGTFEAMKETASHGDTTVHIISPPSFVKTHPALPSTSVCEDEPCTLGIAKSPNRLTDLPITENDNVLNEHKTSEKSMNSFTNTLTNKRVSAPSRSGDSQTSSLSVQTISNQSTSTHSLRWIKQMLLVFGLFVVCWTPSVISTVLYLMDLINQDPIYVLNWFGVANSGINFYVYSFVNPHFRKALKQKIKKLRCCCK